MAKLLNFFKTEEAFRAGSFFQPGKYRVEEIRFILFDADGKWDKQSTVAEAVLTPVTKGKKGWVADKSRNDGNSIRQQWSCGDPQYFKPSKNGTGLVQAGDKETLSESCNFFIFLSHLQKAGFDMSGYDNDISILDGSVWDMKEVPAPERSFSSNVDPSKDEEAGKTARRKTIIVVDEVVEEGGGKPATKGKKDEEEEEEEEGEESEEKEEEEEGEEGEEGEEDEGEKEDSSDPEDLLATYLKSAVCVKANVGGIKIADARSKVFKAMKADSVDADASRNVLKLMNDQKALAAATKAAGWKVEKGIIKK